MSLAKVLVREKGDTRDSKGVYLICQSKTEPEMYELVCRTVEDRKNWVSKIREANAKCPEEGTSITWGKQQLCALLSETANSIRI